MSENKKEDEKADANKEAKAEGEQKKEEDDAEDDAIELNPIKAQFKKSRIVTFYDPPGPLIFDKVTQKEDDINNLI